MEIMADMIKTRTPMERPGKKESSILLLYISQLQNRPMLRESSFPWTEAGPVFNVEP